MSKINLFKATKAGQELHIFGTAHDIAITALPPSVVNFIMSHESLVTENKDLLKPITLEELTAYNFVLQGEDASSLFPFDHNHQKEIRQKIQKYLDFKSSEISIDKLNLNGLLNLYQMAVYFESGMDYSIIRGFLSKKISGLETRHEVIETQELEVSEEDLKKLVYFSNCNIALKNFNQFMKYNLYSGNLTFAEDGISSSSELLTRNTNWLPQIKKLDSSEIICVGLEHLFYEQGILNMLKLDGYSLERMSSSGQFNTADHEEILRGMKLVTEHEAQEMIKLCLEQLNPEEREWMKDNSREEYEAAFSELYAKENGESCGSSEQTELAGAEVE